MIVGLVAEVDAAEVDAAEVVAAEIDAAEVVAAEALPEAAAEIVALVVSDPVVRTVERSDMGEVETVEV